MKKNSLLMIAIAIILSSCGMASRYTSTSSSSRFQDGIYNSSPSFRSRAEKVESRSKTDALLEETKASQIYLFGEKKDTVMIPQNMSASIRYDKSLASTVVTVGENPYSWQYDVNSWYYHTPYSLGSSWYWSRHYDPWYSDPWYWHTWSYSPWRYYGLYDPYYYGGWYDPWYYGYAGWYGHHHHHYCGWYGGWDPYWDYHYHHHYYPGSSIHYRDEWHGSRYQSSSDKVFTSRVPTRGGTSGSSISRNASGTTASRVTTSSGTTGTRPTATRVSATAGRASAIRNNSTVSRTPAANPDRTGRTGTVSNHRKPAPVVNTSSGTSAVRSSTGTSRTYRTGGSSSGSSSYRSSGTSTYRSSGSSSSYRSSGATSPSRSSSYSSGGSSRSYSSGSSSSGGGSSRSGGSSHGRR